MLKSYKTYALIIFAAVAVYLFVFSKETEDKLPLIAIANYGQHPSLIETIEGFQQKMTSLGYIEGQNIRYEISDVNFETSLIMQMLAKLKSKKPAIILAISTPIAQSAKNMIKDTPIIFADVTDPKSAGLARQDNIDANISGASDAQNLLLMLNFAKEILPNAKRVGLMYSNGEANDKALLNMLKAAASKADIEVVAIAVEHSRDIAVRVNQFKGKVDFIYTGSSGAIQSALPVIAQASSKMNIPLINFNKAAVKADQALASFGVAHRKVGHNAAIIADQVMNGADISQIDIMHPKLQDHDKVISSKRAQIHGLDIGGE